MAGLFNLNLPQRSTKAEDSLLLKKTKKAQKSAGVTIKGGNSLLQQISTITAMVNTYLGKYKDNYGTIREEQTLANYIDKAIENGILAIDTETTSLDPISCEIAGMSLYTPNMQSVYIPLHHISYITGIEIEGQISVDFVKTQLERLNENRVKLIFFNAKFDIRVIKNQVGVTLKPYFDGYLAGRLLNENEPEGGLKALHKKYCLNGIGDAFSFEGLFKGIPFTKIPINVGYLYAARDTEITYELYQFQRQYLENQTREDLKGVANVFWNIEMPLISVVVDMEDTGIEIDTEYAEELSVKYNKKLEEAHNKVYEICDQYKADIDKYRAKQGTACKIENPINIDSPVQIAILLYDILGVKVVDKEKPRGTGEEILLKIDHPVCKAILDYRGIAKLLNTYIDKLPKAINPKTKRIHASFNQIGADTGRFSSSDPNLQNIPSHNHDIRKMFKASEGHVLLSSDYSAQEPRLTAHMSKDEKMIQAYREGKDLYVEVASIAYNLPYDECKEFRTDGTKNEAGKERRGTAKAIVLGVCYGKGVASIAEDLKITKKKAQAIYDKIMISFPGLKKFMEDSENMAKELGYVTTVWGRKRRLPDMQLPPYEFEYITTQSNFDPLFGEEEDVQSSEVPEGVQRKFIKLLEQAYGKTKKEAIKATALQQGIKIKENTYKISEATRQCVNSRIQGSAADQTKKAMILIGNDDKLKELGFKLLIPVHDELIGECPEKNAKEVANRFSKLMVETAKDLSVPSKCDVEITRQWYGDTLDI